MVVRCNESLFDQVRGPFDRRNSIFNGEICTHIETEIKREIYRHQYTPNWLPITLMVAVYDCDCDFVDEAHAEHVVKGTFAHADHAAVAENLDYSVHMLMLENAYDDDEDAVDDDVDDDVVCDAFAEVDVDAGADVTKHWQHHYRCRHLRRRCCHRNLHAHVVAVVADHDVIYGDSVDSLPD